jgi:hypothetical protein
MIQNIIFSNYFDIDITKRRIWCLFRIRWKSCNSYEKSYLHESVGIMYFFTFQFCVQKISALSFSLCKLFCYFFNGFELSIKFCVLIPISELIRKYYFLGHIIIICKLWSQTRAKRLKKSKNVFYKCLLEFSFSSINGSGLLTFFKKVKIVVA